MQIKIILFLFIFLSGCSPKPQNMAPDRNFYFTVESNSTSEVAVRNKLHLEEYIPEYKYAITNSSGNSWPYYQAMKLDDEIDLDSLMPPHSFIHKMIPLQKGQKIEENEFVVHIEMFPLSDTIPNYSVSIYRKEKNELILSAKTGIHFIQPNEFNSQSELSVLFLQNILRYSFK